MYQNQRTAAIIAAAGSGRRMGDGVNKQYRELAGRPVLARSIMVFEENPSVDEILVVVKAGEEGLFHSRILVPYGFKKVTAVVAGGAERQDSVFRALQQLPPEVSLVLIHDGARPLVSPQLVDAVLADCARYGAAIPAVPVKDTIKTVHLLPDGAATVAETPPRSTLRAVQTPQGFRRDLLMAAYQSAENRSAATDDASLLERAGIPVYFTEGEDSNLKITTPEDLSLAEFLLQKKAADTSLSSAETGGIKTHPADAETAAPGAAAATTAAPEDDAAHASTFPRCGTGFDVHAFAEGRRLILGGVEIPHERGLLGHSDADVLCHAMMDALLGAAALGDIGKHFPDSDDRYKGISSLKLMEAVAGLLREQRWRIINIDATVIAQRPKIAPFIPQMKKNIAQVLKISESQINIKGTTTERLGFTGREEGIAAQASAAIIQF